MIKLEKGIVLAHIAGIANLFRGYVDERISALATAVSEVMEDVDSSITNLEDGKADNVTMTGATSSAAGKTGLVPAPQSGDREKFLCGDGEWKTPSVFADDSIYDETIEAFAAEGINIT